MKAAVARTRDVPEAEITEDLMVALAARGRPTLLLSLDGRPVAGFPAPVQAYLGRGIRLGIDRRPLCASRNPWYKMEERTPPPIVFTYLGRRNCRFVRNRAAVVPLSGFLCVYPRRRASAFADALWRVLNHHDTLQGLILVGKTYGSGAVKVEPRALERLVLPENALEQEGLSARGVPGQTRLFAMRERSARYRHR
jgi:hypothetical protein